MISFDIRTSAWAEEVDLEVRNAIAQSPDAISISLSTVDGSITISSSEDESINEEDPDEDPSEIDLSGCFIETIN